MPPLLRRGRERTGCGIARSLKAMQPCMYEARIRYLSEGDSLAVFSHRATNQSRGSNAPSGKPKPNIRVMCHIHGDSCDLVGGLLARE